MKGDLCSTFNHGLLSVNKNASFLDQQLSRAWQHVDPIDAAAHDRESCLVRHDSNLQPEIIGPRGFDYSASFNEP